MGRRTRRRFVKSTPDNFYFEGIDPSMEGMVIVTVAEFEAMRLKHYIKLNQSEAAENMGVSQPTFSRILETAHQKVTQAIMEGKKIKVYGGNIEFLKSFRGYGCFKCDHEWEDDQAKKREDVECPKCGSDNVYLLTKEPL